MGFEIDNGILTDYIEEEGVTDIVIPYGVTSIGGYAFSGCKNITNVIIPDSVTFICEFAFNGCKKLKTVKIPESVTKIGGYAFSECQSLTDITIPGSVETIENFTFVECESLTSVVIENGVKNINNSVFEECSSLTSVIIPDSVEYMGFNVFNNTPFFENDERDFIIYNKNLCGYKGKEKDIIIPDGVENIVSFVFSERKDIASVVIPDSVKNIGYYAFFQCSNLKSVVIGKNVRNIGFYAFGDCISLESVVIPDGVTSINEKTFQDCKELRSVVIPDSVRSIGKYAFLYCKKLESVVMSRELTRIGQNAFTLTPFFYNDNRDFVIYGKALYRYNGDESKVVIPDNVVSIGEEAFLQCTGITSVVIPNSVTSIGKRAFNGCYNLESIVIPESVESTGENIFVYCKGIKKLTVYGYTVYTSDCSVEYADINDIIKILRGKDYSAGSDRNIKYKFAVKVFLDDGQREAEKYIRKNFSQIFTYLIDTNEYEAIKGLCESGKFINENNIMQFIEHSIDYTQYSHNMQIQVYLMDYKNKNFPDADPMAELKL